MVRKQYATGLVRLVFKDGRDEVVDLSAENVAGVLDGAQLVCVDLSPTPDKALPT